SNAVLRQPIFDPVTTTVDPTNAQRFLRDAFPGNMIPRSRINPVTAQYIEAYFDRPVSTGVPGFNAINSRPQMSDADTLQLKIDHRFSSKDNIWFRWSDLSIPQIIHSTIKTDFVYDQDPKNVAIGWNRIFSPGLILDSKFGFVTQPVNQFGVTAAGLGLMKQLGYGGVDEFGPVSLAFAAPYSSSNI